MRSKKSKSLYATGVPPCPVSIEGAKPMSKEELLQEHNGLLIVLAAILEQNGGQVLVNPENFEIVKRKKRVLQIVPGPLALSVRFTTYEEPVIPKQETKKDENFLESSVAQEARDFLAKQKQESHDTI